MTQPRQAPRDGVLADDVAFREWYEAALPRVYSYLFNRCGRSRDLAEELTQQTFVAAVRGRHRYRGHADAVTWLIAIARHKLVDHLRRAAHDERRFQRLARDWSGTDATDHVTSSASDHDMLRRLAALPGPQRAALILAYVDDLPVREVARSLGRSESATESLLTRARESYRRIHGDTRHE